VVVARRPFELVIGGQNLGSRTTGREGLFGALTANDLIGLGDRTSVSYYNTGDWSEQRILTVSHDMALHADGLRLGAGLLLGHSEPDLGGAPFEANTFSVDVNLSYPLLRRQEHSLFAAVGFEAVDQELSFGDTQLSDDQLRLLFARLDHQAVDPG